MRIASVQALAFTLILASGPTAAATQSAMESSSYLGILGTYTLADSDRSTDDLHHAGGLDLLFGSAFDNGPWGYELGFHYDDYETGNTVGVDFYRYGLEADLTYAFGDRSHFTPFALAGIGGARNDVVQNSADGYDWTANAGLGFVTGPLIERGQIRLRGEARYVYDNFQGGYGETRFALGIEVPLFAQRQVEVADTELSPQVVEVPTGLLDGDSDGVIDSKDECPDTPAGDRVDGKGCTLQKIMRLDGVTFEFNKTRLRPDAQTILDRSIEILKKYPDMLVEIAGHTDSIGSASYNQKLSEGRARAVKNYFTEHGIPDSQLSVHGYGETQPVDTNDTEAGRERNRRVELRVRN